MSDTNTKKNTPRPPVIAIMGHIDHGKSKLLDYIRKSNIVDKEAGGITQHISAYEIKHKVKETGDERKITFLDTPGHESFSAMRRRGADIADIAVLIVSAEEGVKPQTIEAYKSIKETGIPCIVAINKIDKPEANAEKVKNNLLEKEIYLEGLGGDIPYVLISAVTGEGVDDLLDAMLLVADLEEFKADKEANASGYVLESNLDQKKGISATLIIKSGKIKTGQIVVAGESLAPVRIMEDFKGETIKEATFSSPIKIIGFNSLPQIGSEFNVFDSKKEAQNFIDLQKEISITEGKNENIGEKKIIPVVIKSDVAGSIDAIKFEMDKITNDKVYIKILEEAVGDINENDIKLLGNNEDALVLGFNVKVKKEAKEQAEKSGIEIASFDIIYNLTKWLEEKIKEKTPKEMVEQTEGKAKILKVFSENKGKYVAGGSVKEGTVSVGDQVKIMRRDFEIGKGKIVEIQKQKMKAVSASEGEEFGMMLESKKEIAPSDYIESFKIKEV